MSRLARAFERGGVHKHGVHKHVVQHVREFLCKHATNLRILVEWIKRRIARLEVSVVHAQFVTVPILDARLQTLKAETSVSLMSLESKLSASIQELKTEMERTKADLVRWVFLAMLGNVALGAGATVVVNAFK